jgi:ABC-type Fe3+-hydroxamate transport system substrate-binding protein
MMAKSFYPKELKDLDISKVKINVTEYPITITNKEDPSLKNLNAVKNDKFLVIEHTAFYCGSLQTIDSIEALNSLINE